jgi:hypothetical protein
LTQRDDFTLWINEFFRITCNTVNGYDRVWSYLSKLLKYALVKPAIQQNTALTASASPAANDSFFNAVNNGQHGNPVLNAENIQAMLKNARRQAGHQ